MLAHVRSVPPWPLSSSPLATVLPLPLSLKPRPALPASPLPLCKAPPPTATIFLLNPPPSSPHFLLPLFPCDRYNRGMIVSVHFAVPVPANPIVKPYAVPFSPLLSCFILDFFPPSTYPFSVCKVLNVGVART